MKFKDFGAVAFKPATLEELRQRLAALPQLSTPQMTRLGRLPWGEFIMFALRGNRDEALALLSASQKEGRRCAAVGTSEGLWSLLREHGGIDQERLALLMTASPLEALAAAEILVASQRIDLVLLGPLDEDRAVNNRLDTLREKVRGGRTAVVALRAATLGMPTRGMKGVEKAATGYALDELAYDEEEAAADFPPAVDHLPLSIGSDDDDAEGGALPPLPEPPSRSLNTWFEGAQEPLLPLRVGEEYDFKFQIGRRRPETPGGGATPFAEPDFGRHNGVDLLTTLYSSDFRIGKRSHTFWLPKHGDAAIQETRVVPLRPGLLQLRLVISLRRELEVLQTVVVEVNASADKGGG